MNPFPDKSDELSKTSSDQLLLRLMGKNGRFSAKEFLSRLQSNFTLEGLLKVRAEHRTPEERVSAAKSDLSEDEVVA